MEGSRELKQVVSATTPGLKRAVEAVFEAFEKISGKPANIDKDATSIAFFINRGFTVLDCSDLIAFEKRDPTQSEFYSKPGNFNLRMIFNPSRMEKLLDIRDDLRLRRGEKNQSARGASQVLLMRCKEKVLRSEYEAHLKACFDVKGLCFN